MSHARWRIALVLGTIVLALLLIGLVIVVVGELSTTREPPVEPEGTIRVVMCPDCEAAFHALLLGGGDIQCALYDVGSRTGAVLARVNAQVITDDDTNAEYGTPIPGSGLMHHKFCIINSSVVTSGSYNPTDGGQTGRNNFVIIESAVLARNYAQQFKAVEARRREGAREPLVYFESANGTRVENYFCPADGCEEQVVSVLDEAQERIEFMVFSFTSDPIRDALLRARERGVAVTGACDYRQSRSEHDYNDCAAVDAAFWRGPSILHHKVFIIDAETVVTGSYNPTASGTRRNNENILIVTNEAFAAVYQDEFRAVMAASEP